MKVRQVCGFLVVVICILFPLHLSAIESVPHTSNLPIAEFTTLDPLGWDAEPHSKLSHTITMVAEIIDTQQPVEYSFCCSVGGGSESGWQDSNVFAAKGLKPDSQYTYIAKVRDKKSGKELRSPSIPVTLKTPKADKFDEIIEKQMELIPLVITGNQNNRINLVMINRWTKSEKAPYNNAAMRETFLNNVHKLIDPTFNPSDPKAENPYACLHKLFNIYALWWPDVPPYDLNLFQKNREQQKNPQEIYDPEVSHWITYHEIRRRFFLPWQNEGRGWVTQVSHPNSGGGGGGSGLDLKDRSGDVSLAGSDNIRTFCHEFGHTAFSLNDKYIAWGCFGQADETFNSTMVFQRDKIKWRAWIDPETPIPTPYSKAYLGKIGLTEGGTHRPAFIFRTTPCCIMSVDPFAEHLCALCIQSCYQRAYQWVNPLENPRPLQSALTLKRPGQAHFSISRVKPDPDTQKLEWRLNGLPIAHDTDEVNVNLGAIGEYELTCTLVDETPFVREDPPYAIRPRSEHKWSITNPKPTSLAPPLKIFTKIQNPNAFGTKDGFISLTIQGGKPPYTCLWADGASGLQRTELGEGVYAVQVIDSEFRHQSLDFELKKPATIIPDVRTTLVNNRWNISVNPIGFNPTLMQCFWSNGKIGLSLGGVEDGSYQFTLRDTHGGTYKETVVLKKPEAPLQVDLKKLLPSTDENNGQIDLEIYGGVKPYSIHWQDDPKETHVDRRFLPPGKYQLTVKDANRSTIEKSFEIKSSAAFQFERPVFATLPNGGVKITNPVKGYRYLWYEKDYPTYILRPPRGLYTGTYTDKEGHVFEADGEVIPHTNGKWVNPASSDVINNRDNNEYGAWVRLDAFCRGRKELPVTVRLQSSDSGIPHSRITISGGTKKAATAEEINPNGNWKGFAENGKLVVQNDGPDGGRFDLLYTARHENDDEPVFVGETFFAGKPGNYYLAAQNSNQAISSNRVGVSIYDLPAMDPKINPINPDNATSGKLLLWLDAADVDGDKVEDAKPWDRGSLLGWRGKPGNMRSTSFMVYEPNRLNGKAVASYQYINSAATLEMEVNGFQSIFMVFRNHELSKEGTGPWNGVPACLWDFQESAPPDKLKSANVWLNGVKVDPCKTPSPLDFCVATFEYDSKLRGIYNSIGTWQGDVAECIVFDSVLTEAERKGIEEYLRRKWMSP